LVTINRWSGTFHMDTEVGRNAYHRELEDCHEFRNTYLTPDERKAALSLHRSLEHAREGISEKRNSEQASSSKSERGLLV